MPYFWAMDIEPLEPLNFPDFSFRVRTQGQSKQIYDTVRKRFVALTPEEWVRQNLIRLMSEVYHYPVSLMAVEKKILVNGLSQRADIVVYSKEGQPWLIAECKAPAVIVSQDTFLQAARYNISLNVPYFVLTNGLEHYCLRKSENEFEFISSLPEMKA